MLNMGARFAPYDIWFEALSDTDKNRASQLVAQFKAAGTFDPEAWARSEISEDFAQLARYLILQDVWVHINDVVDEADMWIGDALHPTANPKLPLFNDAREALVRMTGLGVSHDDIAAVSKLAAYNTAWGIVHSLDRERSFHDDENVPGWRLMETDAAGSLTGRNLGDLHESLLLLEEDKNKGEASGNS